MKETAMTAAQPVARLRLTRRGRAVITALVAAPVVIAISAFALNGGGAVADSEGSAHEFEYTTVLAGQSLWQLAADIAPQADPGDVVADILSLNRLTSSEVQGGQRLAIPAAYSN
ncbi:LysM peptidoglycan-binding domain-containing protein [Cryobacterium sp. BB736]|uniref:LysM peptidoglycan-binding domain-containing protein n=1 Tax=Cryobacterium sp. BB736 TaxID=2746963 RepID=UPI001874ABD5|nr:LysM peptidoglycan-binding domain-containing protein [Cryobacterium sp. BB736]